MGLEYHLGPVMELAKLYTQACEMSANAPSPLERPQMMMFSIWDGLMFSLDAIMAFAWWEASSDGAVKRFAAKDVAVLANIATPISA